MSPGKNSNLCLTLPFIFAGLGVPTPHRPWVAHVVGQFQGIRGPAGTLVGASRNFISNCASFGKEAFECRCVIPCTQCGRDSHGEDLTEPAPKPVAVLVESPPQDLRKFQLEYGPCRREGPEAQRLLQLWERLIVDQGLLKRKYEDARGNSSWQQLVVEGGNHTRTPCWPPRRTPWCGQKWMEAYAIPNQEAVTVARS